jgi:hypothetical protein
MKLNRESFKRLIRCLTGTGILTLILLTISFAVWVISYDHSVERLISCLFWVGVVGVALGTIFGLNAHGFSEDVFYRHYIGATSTTIEESRHQAWKDIGRSYASALLFIISGLVLIGISFLIELF